MLYCFAKQVMSQEEFTKLSNSYRQLFWFQLFLPTGAVLLIAVLCLIFNSYVDVIIMVGVTAFILLFIIWLILSQFVVGRLWHKYVKLYKGGVHPNVMKFDLFG